MNNGQCFVDTQKGRGMLLSLCENFQSHGHTLLHVQTQPVDAAVEGKIPNWLHGSYIRNGPGTFRGMKHLFDGYAMLVKFSFEDGKVLVSQR